MPRFAQLVLVPVDPSMTPYALERRAYATRKRAEHETGTYFSSLSSRTLVYKGMLTTGQLQPFFPTCPTSVHQRAGPGAQPLLTNTFPSWPLAHPYRYIAHNGEINTVKGNRNWMRAREALLRGPDELPDDLGRCSRSARPAPRTARASTRCSSCCTWAAGRCRTRC
jgi:glutamate synthase domain-containing protein 1